jgi:hypothetical protein
VKLLPQITKAKSFPYSTILIFGTSALAVLAFAVKTSLSEYFSPAHTNAYSHYTQFSSQMLLTVSLPLAFIHQLTGSLFGI